MASSSFSRVATRILDDYILSGKLSNGDKLPSVRDLQNYYSVSRSTVWHALGVLETKGFVIKKQGSGCYVSSQRVADVPKMHKLIGLVGDSDISGMLCYQAQKGVESFCERRGYHLLVASTSNDYPTEEQQVRRMIDSGCSGIILLAAPRTQEQLKNDYLKTIPKSYPMVLVDIAYPEQNKPRVVFDNYQAGYDLTELFISRGHKRIAFMVAPEYYLLKSTWDRYEGYVDAMQAAGLPVRDEDKIPIWPNSLPGSIDQQFKQMLINWKAGSDKWTAMLSLHDGMAMSLISMAEEIGIRIPEDLVIAGFDNYVDSRAFRPPFPTTSPDFAHAGRMAARMLIRHIDTGVFDTDAYVLPVPVLDRGLAAITEVNDLYSVVQNQ